MNPRQVLKQLLKRDKLLVAPGCFDGLSARLVEEAGFEAAYLSGGAAGAQHGHTGYRVGHHVRGNRESCAGCFSRADTRDR